MLSLDNLRVLSAIAQSGSFAAAGELLHKVPSAISYAIQRLEQELQVELFDRQGHKARLTAAGQAVLREGQQLLQQAEQLGHLARCAAQGWEPELRIAFDALLPLPAITPLIAEFQQLNPPTELCFSQEVLAGGWEALSTGRADLVVGVTGDPPSGCQYQAMGLMPMYLLAAAQHPLNQSRPLSPADLAGHYGIVLSDSSRLWPRRTLRLFPGQKLLRVTDMASKVALIEAGLGVGFIPASLALSLIGQQRLVRLDFAPEATDSQLYLGWKPQAGLANQWWRQRLLLQLWLDSTTDNPIPPQQEPSR